MVGDRALLATQDGHHASRWISPMFDGSVVWEYRGAQPGQGETLRRCTRAGSVPLSLTQSNSTTPGNQRRQFAGHPSPRPDSDVSVTRLRHSRVKSSTTTRMRNRRPSVSVSETKSSDHAGLALAAASSVRACPTRVCVRRGGAPAAVLRYTAVAASCGSCGSLRPAAASDGASQSADALPQVPSAAAGRRIIRTPMAITHALRSAPMIEHARRSLIPCASRAAVTAALRAAGVTTFLP